MKQLMIGNAAVARGLYEAGCGVASSYPGTPSTEITEEAAKYDEIYCEWAPNEKVALEVAFGAAVAGKRSFCGMKHVGLNVAADPLFTISYTGINAGMIIGVADDAGMHSSQNEQDSRHYAIAAKLPMLEPSDSEESRVFAKKAFEMSEKFNTPVLLKMVTRVAHSQSIVDTEERVEPAQVPYVKDPTKVMMTLNSRNAHVRVEQRTKDLIEYAENCEFNRVEMGKDTSVGIITDSTSYQYAREVLGDKVSILKLGMINPLPEKLIKDFAQKVDKVIVLEELDPIIENHCKQLGIKVAGKDTFPICGEFSQNLVRSIDADAPESIHLCDYPEVNEAWIDKDLEANMEELLEIVVLGRACRNTANIKNRQPIGTMYVKAEKAMDKFYTDIIADELNVKEVKFADDVESFISYSFKPQLRTVGPKYGKLLNGIRTALSEIDGTAAMKELRDNGVLVLDIDGNRVELAEEDLLIETAQSEGYVTETDGETSVVLDTNLTPELIQEGFVREIISKVQTMRKEAGFEVMDKIIVYAKDNDKIMDIMKANQDEIKREVLAENIILGEAEGYTKEWNINKEAVTLGVSKVQEEN